MFGTRPNANLDTLEEEDSPSREAREGAAESPKFINSSLKSDQLE